MHRVHYGVNCASLGCPNLQSAAFTAENTENLLERGAKEYVNHPRGVAVRNQKLRVSSIYVWFREDFGGNADDLMEHWREYADGPLAAALQSYSGGLEHDYDWRLNGVESQTLAHAEPALERESAGRDERNCNSRQLRAAAATKGNAGPAFSSRRFRTPTFFLPRATAGEDEGGGSSNRVNGC